MSGNLWNNVKYALEQQLSPDDYRLWIKPIRPFDNQSGEMALACPSKTHAARVKSSFLPLIQAEYNLQGAQGNVSLVSDSRSTAVKLSQPHPGHRQLDLPSISWQAPMLNRRFIFDRFIPGSGNELACAAAKAIAGKQRFFSNSLFLVSETGMGKSHLTQAVGHHLLNHAPETKVAYLTAEDFTNQMIKAIRQHSIEAFKERFRYQCDVLLLEEVSFLSGKEKTQDELGYTLDALMDAGKRVIFTSNKEPSDIKGLKLGLESRLTSGISISIEPPDFNTRVRILQELANEEGIYVEREVLEFLAQEITSDVRRLRSALTSLMAKSSLTGRPLDLGMAAEVVGQIAVRLSRLTTTRIRSLVAKVYGLEIDILVGKSRRKVVTKPRNLAMYLSRKHTDASFAAIGRDFNRDHATVMYSVDKIERGLSQEAKLRQELVYLEKKLGVQS